MTKTEAPEIATIDRVITGEIAHQVTLPRIQKIAEPAPTRRSNGMHRQKTARYCWLTEICRPTQTISLATVSTTKNNSYP